MLPRRRLAHAIIVTSLLVCLLGVVVLWRSRHQRIELASHSTDSLMVVLACDGGTFEIYAVSAGTAGLGQDEVDVGFLGWRFEQSAYVVGRSFTLTVPLWAWVAAFGAFPAVVIARAARRRRSAIRVGYCASCGYDLRATPNCCPECGSAADVPR